MTQLLLLDEVAHYRTPHDVATDRALYVAECAQRWHGPALADARRNWRDFEELKPALAAWLRSYHLDPFQEHISGVKLNPEGTLTAFLWTLQERLQPNRSCLHPFLDFEERHQKIFLRRGLLIYCAQILRQLAGGAA